MPQTAPMQGAQVQEERGRFIQYVTPVLRTWGCPSSGIAQPYRLPFPIRGLETLDVVGFAESGRQDQETSCFAAHFCVNDEAERSFHAAARPIATPILLSGRPGGKITVLMLSKGKPKVRQRLKTFESLAAYAQEEGSDLRAEAVSESKRPRGDVARQLELFPGIFDLAFDATAEEVPSLYQTIVQTCLANLERLQADGKWQPGQMIHDELSPLASEALRASLLVFGARVLHDKGYLESAPTDARALLDEAASGEFRFFFDRAKWDYFPEVVLNEIAEGLRKYLFTFLSPYGIGMLYERAFVSDELRQKLAIHYTPVSVADHIVSRLPIADIPPGDRYAVDFTSGSGTFLHSVLEQLRELRSGEIGQSAPFRSFLNRVHGNDTDAFARVLSSLSLMMRTAVNGWSISGADMQDWEPRSANARPTIIVGNPPFRLDIAFVGKCLDVLPPGGLMGVVLPSDFRDQFSAEAARRRLLIEADILEVIEIPKGLFARSNKPTIALIGRKRGGDRRRPPCVKVIDAGKKRGAWWEFLATRALASETAVVQESWLNRRDASMSVQQLADLWSDLAASCSSLGDNVDRVGIGIILRGRDADLKGVGGTEFIADRNPGGWLPYLAHAAALVGPFAIRWEGHRQFIDYRKFGPRFRKGLTPDVLGAPKVLLPASTDEQNPWRLRACVDDMGLYVNQRLIYVLTRPGGPTREELAAVLNTPVASAWYADNSVQRDILCNTLKQLPFPGFGSEQQGLLLELVRSLQALNSCDRREEVVPEGLLASATPPCPIDAPTARRMIRELMLTVDDIVFDAYGLNKRDRQRILKRCPLEERPGFPPEVDPTDVQPVRVLRNRRRNGTDANLSTAGRVLAVDRASGLAIGSVDGLRIGVPVPLSLRDLPKPIHEAGRHFKVLIVDNADELREVTLACIKPYRKADRPKEEIAAELGKHTESVGEIELGR